MAAAAPLNELAARPAAELLAARARWQSGEDGAALSAQNSAVAAALDAHIAAYGRGFREPDLDERPRHCNAVSTNGLGRTFRVAVEQRRRGAATEKRAQDAVARKRKEAAENNEKEVAEEMEVCDLFGDD